MHMTWLDLLFVHWPMPAGALRNLIPAGLELDLYEGQAWLGIVPFRMQGVRPRGVPSLPGFSAFPELNVRTYVTTGGQPGVWFFSLDADNRLAVRGARWSFCLPYYDAQIKVVPQKNRVNYRSRRTHRKAPAAEFVASYEPTSDVYRALPGTLEHWLTERYCLYVQDRRSQIWRGHVHHLPWPLQAARAEIKANTMSAPLGLQLPNRPPLLHFARRLDTVAWLLERVIGQKDRSSSSRG